MATPLPPSSRRPLAGMPTPCWYALSSFKSWLFSPVLLSALCYAMSCHAMLCYAMLCYAMLCHAMPCHSQLAGIDTVHMQHLHRDCALCVQDDHGMQQEIQDLQQELQSTKTALQLSKDRLQKQDAAINCLNCEAEVCLLVW